MQERQTIYSIQFLRGIAALMVLAAHVLHEEGFYAYGVIGVDLFFTISGFIIYHVTRHDRSHFLLKRIIRIVPLYWLATFAVAAVGILRPDLLNSASFSLEALLRSLFFVPYVNEAGSFQPLLTVGWTLNFEMVFYLLFMVGMRLSHARRFEITSLLLVGLYLLCRALPLAPDSAIAFFTKPVYLEFIAGMAIARMVETRGLARTGSPVALLLAIAVFVVVNGLEPTGWRLVDFGLPAVLLFLAVLRGESWFAGTAAMRRLSVLGGEISFSLYLCHYYFLAVFARLLHLDGLALALACFLVIPVASWASYRLIEAPSTRLLRRWLLGRRPAPPAAPLSAPLSAADPAASELRGAPAP